MRLNPEIAGYLAASHDVYCFSPKIPPDLAALVPALGLVQGVDSFVLLDGDGWGTQVLAFGPELSLTVENASPFDALCQVLVRKGSTGLDHPLQGGPALFGYLSYDAARYLERLPATAEEDLRFPAARFIMPRYTVGVGPDGEAWASVPAGESADYFLRTLREVPLSGAMPDGTLRVANSTLRREEYAWAVESVKEYVRAGDVFQTNISQRFEVPFEGTRSLFTGLYGEGTRRRSEG